MHEHVKGTTDFIQRLAGEEVLELYPRNSTGLLCREIVGDDVWPVLAGQYMPVIERPGVGYSIGPILRDTLGRAGMGERLILPLLGETGEVDFIIGATKYSPPDKTPGGAAHIKPMKTLTPVFQAG